MSTFLGDVDGVDFDSGAIPNEIKLRVALCSPNVTGDCG
jgi:hypothetical protein